MNDSILALSELAAQDGSSVFPGGPGVLHLLDWDRYRNYYEIDTQLKYIWRVELAFLSNDDSVLRIRQTINLDGHGLYRKHELAFAFNFQDLAGSEIIHFRGEHPGAGRIPIPGLYHGYDPAFVSSAGPPIGLQMTFQKPVVVRRWSCLPITADAIEQEMSVFQISIWFATFRTAQRARNTFDDLMKNPATSSTSNTGSATTLAPPRFEEIPAMPPGGISRF